MMKRDLQSLTGILQHATKVVCPGKAFMKRLHVLQSVGNSPSHNPRLHVAVWWQTFVARWNSGLNAVEPPEGNL